MFLSIGGASGCAHNAIWGAGWGKSPFHVFRRVGHKIPKTTWFPAYSVLFDLFFGDFGIPDLDIASLGLGRACLEQTFEIQGGNYVRSRAVSPTPSIAISWHGDRTRTFVTVSFDLILELVRVLIPPARFDGISAWSVEKPIQRSGDFAEKRPFGSDRRRPPSLERAVVNQDF